MQGSEEIKASFSLLVEVEIHESFPKPNSTPILQPHFPIPCSQHSTPKPQTQSPKPPNVGKIMAQHTYEAFVLQTFGVQVCLPPLLGGSWVVSRVI